VKFLQQSLIDNESSNKNNNRWVLKVCK